MIDRSATLFGVRTEDLCLQLNEIKKKNFGVSLNLTIYFIVAIYRAV